MPRKLEPGIRNRIKEFRASEEGMTQQFLADHVGVTRQTIVALEAEGYTPSLTLALRIAQLFGKSVEEVFWIDE
ncbi:DNA-binding transcriptional regulator [Haloferula helveola]|uniref:DNA-binding transcriptional regulator n=1 Tax=Haloferula helveola TaxID=490095 RepID=A0ABN6H019_9BACT|nr:DNA-binding transcriptional regulator [Haloferula helveola]